MLLFSFITALLMDFKLSFSSLHFVFQDSVLLQWTVYSEIAEHNMLSMFFPPWSHTSTDFFLSVLMLFAAAHQQTISPVPIRCGFAQCSSHCTVSPPRFGGSNSRKSLMHSCISYTCTLFSQCVRENSDWCWWWGGGPRGAACYLQELIRKKKKGRSILSGPKSAEGTQQHSSPLHFDCVRF